MVLLHAKSGLNRRAGPLASLLLWIECALSAWPRAQLVGKADDDIWAHLPGTASLLRGSLEAARHAMQLDSVSQVRLYWGMMETYHWELKSQRPVSFAFKYGKSGEACALRNYRMGVRQGHKSSSKPVVRPLVTEVHNGAAALNATPHLRENETSATYGPFHFAKGPMFYMSSSLASGLMHSLAVQRNWDATMATTNMGSIKGIRPWEDVWSGLALALSAAGDNLAAVHMGLSAFSEGGGTAANVGPSTVLWHAGSSKSLLPERIRSRENSSHCARPELPKLVLNCARNYVSCSGATWLRCLYVNNNTVCPKTRPKAKM